jgi:hypothetical protein
MTPNPVRIARWLLVTTMLVPAATFAAEPSQGLTRWGAAEAAPQKVP